LTILGKLEAAVLVLSVSSSLFFYEQLQAQKRDAAKQQNAIVVADAAAIGAVNAKLVTQTAAVAAVSAENQDFVKKLAAAYKQLKVSESIGSKVVVTEVIKTVPGAAAGEYDLSYNRGTFKLPEGLLNLTQSFSYSAVVALTPDGSGRILKDSFVELDPVTGLAIPGATSSLRTNFLFTKADLATPPSVFHVKGVGGLSDAGFVLGAQVLNLEKYSGFFARLTLGGHASYSEQSRDAGLAAMLGYRLFNTNLHVGPTYGIIFGKPGGRIGAAIVLEVTR
jgi:hypothetical protein